MEVISTTDKILVTQILKDNLNNILPKSVKIICFYGIYQYGYNILLDCAINNRDMPLYINGTIDVRLYNKHIVDILSECKETIEKILNDI